MVHVVIMGVDTFDPTKGEVMPSDKPPDDIACWLVVDDCGEEASSCGRLIT
jgi:hypothetical protein